MSDRFIEKTFLYLLAASVFIHAGLFALILFLPQEKKPVSSEPYMVELLDLPKPKETPAESKKETLRIDEQKRRVERETAPKGKLDGDRIASRPPRLSRPQPRIPQAARQQPAQSQPLVPQRPVQRPGEQGTIPQERGEYSVRGESSPKRVPATEPPLRRPDRLPNIKQLMPSAKNLEKLEETYRNKYENVEEGDTALMDTDNPILAPFNRRFNAAVEEQWDSYRHGFFKERGLAVLHITILRDGTIEEVDLLESTGNKILDQVAIKTVRTASYVGPLPEKWPHKKLNLIFLYHVY